jgi:hypothetical protein
MATQFRIRAVALSAALSVFVLSFPAVAPAQQCNPSSITLSNQDEVDHFQSDHGPCDTLGTLTINGEDITNLTGLSGLARVDGNLLEISGNPRLENLGGLESLISVAGDLLINDNDVLVNIDGLSSLSQVTIDPVYKIEILRNAALRNLDGLASLTGLEGALIIHLNDSLSNIHGLSNLEQVGAFLHIAANHALTDLNGLENLTSVGVLGIVNNTSLADISGLSNLETVRLWFEIGWNPLLDSVDGLSALTRVGVSDPVMGNLQIHHNQALKNLDGLSALQSVHGLILEYNPSLTDCQGIIRLVDPIDDYEPGPGPGVAGIPDIGDKAVIKNNSNKCYSVNSILGDAPLAEINQGLNDVWFNPDTAGQGLLITAFPEIRQLFVAWFTYDIERPPSDVTALLGEPGHRWLTAQGDFDENTAWLEINLAEGGVFDSPEPRPMIEPVGEILLEFSTCNAGTVSYDIPSIARQGIIPIERIVLDNAPLCYLLGKEQAMAE